MPEPLVDLIIAVHSETRPIARAVASVIDHTSAPVRVNVVAHNIDPEIIRRNLGEYADHPGVRLLELRDGIPSPAGPMNHGLAHSEAAFVGVMGSDDELAPGAIDSWLALQLRTGASAVLARIQLADGRCDPYPPVRNGRRTLELDPRKDRLAYRSAPLGIVDRREFGDLRFTEGLRSGEDLAYSLTVWFTGKHLAYDLSGPAYVINADAGDRVTSAPRPLAEDFAFLDVIEQFDWFTGLDAAGRRAIVLKTIRIHLFDAILARARTDEDLAAHRAELAALVQRLLRLAPGAAKQLSIADARAIREAVKPDSTAASVLARLDARHKYLSPATLIARSPLHSFRQQAPFRTLFAGFRIMRTSTSNAG